MCINIHVHTVVHAPIKYNSSKVWLRFIYFFFFFFFLGGGGGNIYIYIYIYFFFFGIIY